MDDRPVPEKPSKEAAMLRVTDIQDAVVDAIQQQARILELPSWPVYGWMDGGRHGWLSWFAKNNSELESLRLSYQYLDKPKQLIVQTQMLGSPVVSPVVSLSRLITWIERCRDDEEIFDQEKERTPQRTLTQYPVGVEVLIDGSPHEAKTWESATSTVWQLNTDRVRILIAARGFKLSTLRLEQVRDLRPHQRERDRIVAAYLDEVKRRKPS